MTKLEHALQAVTTWIVQQGLAWGVKWSLDYEDKQHGVFVWLYFEGTDLAVVMDSLDEQYERFEAILNAWGYASQLHTVYNLYIWPLTEADGYEDEADECVRPNQLQATLNTLNHGVSVATVQKIRLTVNMYRLRQKAAVSQVHATLGNHHDVVVRVTQSCSAPGS